MQTVAHAAVFCTKACNVTGNKYKFVQIVKKQLPQGPDWSVAKEKKCMCYNGTCIWQLKVYVCMNMQIMCDNGLAGAYPVYVLWE